MNISEPLNTFSSLPFLIRYDFESFHISNVL